MTPPEVAGDVPTRWFVSRDREEELADFVRGTVPDAESPRGGRVPAPLPYLYLARSVFGRRRSALPGAGLAAARRRTVRRGARRGLRVRHRGRQPRVDHRSVELAALAVPEPHGHTACRSRARVNALDARLREVKYLGGWDRLNALAGHASFASSGPDSTERRGVTRRGRRSWRRPRRCGPQWRQQRRCGRCARRRRRRVSFARCSISSARTSGSRSTTRFRGAPPARAGGGRRRARVAGRRAGPPRRRAAPGRPAGRRGAPLD